MLKRLIPYALFAACTGGLVAQTPAADALKTRLHEGELLTSLDQPDSKPWHLRLDVQLYDSKGLPTEQGTIEEWWRAPQAYRIEYKLPSYTATEVRNGSNDFATDGAISPPNVLESLLTQVVHPMPAESEITSATPEMRKDSFGKVELECVMLDHMARRAGDAHLALPGLLPLGLFPTYCFDPGKPNLRVTADIGSQMIVRNGLGTFAGRQVPINTTVTEAGHLQGSAKIVLLKGGEVQNELFEQGSLLPLGQGLVKIAGGVVAGLKLSGVAPVYPQSAKQARVSGTVILHAVISRDGRVRSLRVVSTPDADLALAALFAVRQWRYRPYLLNGQPTEVDTTVMVNFTFG